MSLFQAFVDVQVSCDACVVTRDPSQKYDWPNAEANICGRELFDIKSVYIHERLMNKATCKTTY
jgi:hypothetical protein